MLGRCRKSLIPVLVVLSVPLSAQSAPSRWYLVRMAGRPVGWMHELRSTTDSGIALTTSMRLVLNRLGSSVVMEESARSLEAGSGALLTADATMRLSEQATHIHATVIGDSVRLSTTAAGRSFERTIAATRSMLGPDAIDRLTEAKLKRRGDSVTYGMFDATSGAPGTTSRSVVGVDTVQIGARRLAARRIIERSSTSPVAVSYWLDQSGAIVRSSYDSPFGVTVSELVDSVTAMGANEGASFSADQYASTLATTQIRLPQPRHLAMLRLELTRRDTSVRWPAFDGPGERVLDRTADRLTLEVTRLAPPPGRHAFPVAPTPLTREYLEPNAYIQSDEPSLHALALRIVGSETDAWRAALALQRWVSDNMQFDLGVTFAPSVEVVERRRGTCVAYATLLAALTRTVGIPSRVAFGFGYVNGILGGHAWTEVLIGDRWVGLDGALFSGAAADAARFAFARGSLAGGPAELTNSVGAQLYGRIGVRVLAYQVAEQRSVAVARNAAPYDVTGDVYANPFLGVTVRKPTGARFVELDERWPSMTILGIADAQGDTVRIKDVGRVSPAKDGTWLEISHGGDTLVVEASGPESRAALRTIAPRVTLSRP